MSKLYIPILLVLLILLSGCSSKKSRYYYYGSKTPKPRTYSASSNDYATKISDKDLKYAKMNPYVVYGIRYYPRTVEVGDIFHGTASWYGPDFHSKPTANGEQYDMHAMTAAHKTFPMHTVVRVTNNNNGRSAIVRINDRGPFVGTRIIDLSNAAARKVEMVGTGTAPVTLEVLGYYSKTKKTKAVAAMPVKRVQKKEKDIVIPQVIGKEVDTSAYSLQIASFTNIEGAMSVQEKYNGIDGYKSVIKDTQTDSTRFFKVYLRGFKSETEVRSYKASSDFQNAFIVKE